jgi:PPOX class probable F420-dependent enzyme
MAELEGRPLEIVKEGQNYAIVAIPLEDGSVQSVIVWGHADDDGNLTLNSAEGRAWPANLRKAGRATVTMMADGNPYEWVSIRGKLIGDTQDGADDDINMLAKKYIGEDEYPWKGPDEVRVKFTLEPEKVTYIKQG